MRNLVECKHFNKAVRECREAPPGHTCQKHDRKGPFKPCFSPPYVPHLVSQKSSHKIRSHTLFGCYIRFQNGSVVENEQKLVTSLTYA